MCLPIRTPTVPERLEVWRSQRTWGVDRHPVDLFVGDAGDKSCAPRTCLEPLLRRPASGTGDPSVGNHHKVVVQDEKRSIIRSLRVRVDRHVCSSTHNTQHQSSHVSFKFSIANRNVANRTLGTDLSPNFRSGHPSIVVGEKDHGGYLDPRFY